MITTYKGAPIFYSDKGQGDALILLHGFLENSSMWLPFIPELTKTHRVICIDILGHGKTPCIGYIHTMEEMAAAVNAVIESLQLAEVSLIGHSMGGYVGCAFAKAYPKKLRALCLLNSSPLPDDAERKSIRSRANTMAKENYEQLVRMSFTNLFDATTRKTHEKEIALAMQEALQTPAQGYIAANSGMQLRSGSKQLWKEGDFYKSMILGEKDWILDCNAHKNQFEKHTDYFKILPGGHMSHISQISSVLYHIHQFLIEV